VADAAERADEQLDIMRAAQVTNLERLRALGEASDGSVLDVRLQRRAELQAARVQHTRGELERTRSQAAQSSGEARAALDIRIAALREKLAGATGTLETVSGLLERRGFAGLMSTSRWASPTATTWSRWRPCCARS
jgi:hypothetical protein